jgi:hypothetical protein
MQVALRAVSRSFVFVIAAALLSPFSLPSRSAKPKPPGPAQTVDKFCRLDFDGVRLSSTHPSTAEFARLIGGEGDWPDEPVKIVAAFRLLSVRENQDAAAVKVEYKLSGQLRGALEADRMSLERRSENVEFLLFRTEGLWKVKVFDLPPHVSTPALRDHIRDVMKDDEKQGDSHRRDLLQRLLLRLGSTGP